MTLNHLRLTICSLAFIALTVVAPAAENLAAKTETKVGALFHGRFVSPDLTALLLAQTSSSPELITNSDFANGLDDWKTQKMEDAQASFDVKPTEDGKHALVVRVPQPASKRYYVQIIHNINDTLNAGKSYTLSFRAKSKPGAPIVVIIRSGATDVLKQDGIALTDDWKDYSYTFTPGQDTASTSLTISGLGATAAEYSFANISLKAAAPGAAPTADVKNERAGTKVSAAFHGRFVSPNLTSLLLAQASPPSELITNSDFANGLDDWKMQKQEDGEATVDVKPTEDGKHALVVTVPQAATKRYYVQVVHAISATLSAGKNYTLSFRAKSKPGALVVFIIRSGATDVLKQDGIALAEDWKDYSYNFTPAQDTASTSLTISGLAAAAADYSFSNISLKETAAGGQPVSPSAAATSKPSTQAGALLHGSLILQNLAPLLLAQAVSSPELITNSDFAKGLDDWKTQKLEDAQATFDVKATDDGKHALVVTVAQVAAKRYYVQILHAINTPLAAGKSYTLSFRGKSKPGAPVVVVVNASGETKVELFRQEGIALTEEWQNFSYTFTPGQESGASGLLISGLGATAGEYSFADVSLKEAPAAGQPASPSASTTSPTPIKAGALMHGSLMMQNLAPLLLTQTASSPEMITNSDFSNGLDGWKPQKQDDGQATFDVATIEDGKHALVVTVPQPATKRYYVQVFHPINDTLRAGKSYTVSFRAKSKPGAPIVIIIGAGAKNLLKQDGIALTEDWKDYSYTFTTGEDAANPSLAISGLAATAAEYSFTNVSLKEAAATGDTSTPGATPSTPPASAPAPAPTAATAPEEKTPTSIPGAEAFVYRDGTPDPMRLFVFKPSGWQASDHRPVMIFFFGGGWTHGSPAAGADFARLSTAYGMVGIAPDYRTKTRFGTSPLESVADSRAAFRWVQDHAAELGIDPARIIVGGHSAGGHVALWTAIDKTPPGSDPNEAPKNKPAALFLLAPVSDTSPTGYTPFRFGANALALSPVHQLDGKMPPTLLVHADTDEVVPYRESVALNEALLKNGAVCEFDTVPNGKHGFPWITPEFNTHKLMERLMVFLKANGINIEAPATAAK